LGFEEVNRFERLKNLEQDYLRTLTEKPWLKCNCIICSEYGIHVCVFRTNERNMRRGFHNLYQFYSRLDKWLNEEVKEEIKCKSPKYVEKIPLEKLKDKKILVITACSQTKIGNNANIQAKAKNMYQGRLFKISKKLSEKMNWDYVILSAKYGLLFPEDEIKGYEKFLKYKRDINEVKPKIIPKLKEIIIHYDYILVIAGKKYREILDEIIDDRFIYIKSKGYGDLCSKINNALLCSHQNVKINDFF